MNKNLHRNRVWPALSALTLTMGVLSACGGEGTAEPTASTQPTEGAAATQAPAKPVNLSLIEPDGGRVWRADNPVTLEIEARTGVKLAATLVPNGDFANKYNVLAASGDIPDMSRLNAFDFQKFADQGLYLDVAPLIEKFGPNLKKALKQELWDLTKFKGKQYVIPYENGAGKEVPIIRADWLAALDLKMPTTLDELTVVLEKFTTGDPDKNGKADTYGFGTVSRYDEAFMPIFGAFGIAPGYIGQGTPANHYLRDGKIVPTAVSAEYKAAIEYIKKLWDAKVIDPEMFTIKPDQAQQKAAQGKIGFSNAWWSIAPQVLMQQLKMKELNPNAKWDPVFPGVTGPQGKSGMLSYGNIGGGVAISAKAANPEAVVKFLDYLATDEGWEMSRFGIKGTHYNSIAEPRLPEGQKALDEKWLDPLSQLISRLDLNDKVTAATTDPVQVENNRFTQAAAKYTLYQDAFYGVPMTDAQKTYGADLSKYEEEMLIKFITGSEPLSKWDEYVDGWKKKGGKAILDAKVQAYNELKSTSVAPGV